MKAILVLLALAFLAGCRADTCFDYKYPFMVGDEFGDTQATAILYDNNEFYIGGNSDSNNIKNKEETMGVFITKFLSTRYIGFYRKLSDESTLGTGQISYVHQIQSYDSLEIAVLVSGTSSNYILAFLKKSDGSLSSIVQIPGSTINN